MVIEENVRISKDVISIGDGTYICRDTDIENCKSIGKYCSIAKGACIGLGKHPKEWVSTSPLFYSRYRGLVKDTLYDYKIDDKKVEIGNDVWIGTNTLILNNINIGNGAIIGAGSVVTKNVEEYSIVAGIPAKVIGYRFDKEVREKFINKKISELDISYFLENLEYIDNPNLFEKNI
ncbi:CatB-related O-acetyltransferase [Clostridium perfringens]|uniref:CatB-related O-acetyltransferase n=1 Tax=Clostridium perfringens TaxID=1502 RepID=UPI0013E32AFC|nr:CatB-related O-acetyltransferase [Clostridium perfringens]MDK0655132.1 CatB-related O-acetyltransferase [Clostridium perfringens]MDK0689225.1 CatB-related O-acetyltransferase [Clostridium perfringens]MDM0506545.1 CatB-related O-acetyltransferase [Clostridium perfringens]MDM0709774.1 CatB-related O-acetyltransferase [Clostridium perfringens]MDM0911809.1 CatB-related O-acetyltransferase [Clostridium perfringens]